MPLHHLWDNYYPPVAVVEERVVMPRSALSFIIILLIGFAEIKSQGQPEFPFKTLPHHVRFSITSLLMYGLFCAAEFVASGFDRISVYVVVARLGKICSLFILVTSFACLFHLLHLFPFSGLVMKVEYMFHMMAQCLCVVLRKVDDFGCESPYAVLFYRAPYFFALGYVDDVLWQ
ncbi:hypothetical protein HanXRQr2_Chr13g0607861 [Helianthus annuus]|uniref:Uncharacterized protein n=1 Tax=Helianthus annuus TaxID=4232 RepID=A0A9K3EJL9_HELAN|nr:hypothetical protein HanXRQr2_Chr13g0607861 [Helianthus annuus]